MIFLLLAASAHAEPLGRLFFTPRERAMLDSIRQHPGQTLLQGVDTGEGKVTGSVELQGGGKTVWIDGAPRHLESGQKK